MALATAAPGVKFSPPRASQFIETGIIQSDLAAEIQAYLSRLSIDQLACLAYAHKWPELIPVPGRRLPKGFRVLPVAGEERQGCYMVTETCSRCRGTRISYTLPRGIFDMNVKRSYRHEQDWMVRPEGSCLGRRHFLAEIYRRLERDLFPGEYALWAAGGR